ncbi:MAG: quinate 5-dehydrogenase [Chloroflexota bacterium]
MKKVVSISLGSKKRDFQDEIELLGEKISVKRVGVDGDSQKAKALFEELDGQVDVLSVGGIDLFVQFGTKRYSIRAAQQLVKNVTKTPIVDGTGLKNTLERHVVHALVEQLGDRFTQGRVLLTAATDRYGMTQSFVEHAYEVVFGDLMFTVGLPIPVRSFATFNRVASLLTGPVTKLPISMLYPTGQEQETIVPKFEKWYQWATVIAGDCHFIKRHMPDDLSGKVILTNTTTPADRELFRQRRVRYLMTTTPVINGRSFGTNLLEAAITAVSGRNRPLTFAELNEIIQTLGLTPQVHSL